MCAGATDSHGSRPCAIHSSSCRSFAIAARVSGIGDDEQPLPLREPAARRAADGAADPLERLARHGLRLVVAHHAALLEKLAEVHVEHRDEVGTNSYEVTRQIDCVKFGRLSWLRHGRQAGRGSANVRQRVFAQYNTYDARNVFSHLLRRVRPRRDDRHRTRRPTRGQARSVPGRRDDEAGRLPHAACSSRDDAHRRRARTPLYSHSIVAGGFDVTSRTTRFTAGISFTMRDEIVSIRSYGNRAQSAVIASSLVTARSTIG